MFNVLVVDDEKEIRDAIEIYLRGENLNIIKAGDGVEALELLESNNIHLIILDVMMPKLDGIKTCLEIRKNRNIPIIMLSAKGEDSDKILGLNVGADDYMTKPFNNMELVARVKSQLRRFYKLNPRAIKKEDDGKTINIEDMVINLDTHEIFIGDKVIKLTPTEFDILVLLAKNKGKVFSIANIYESVWNQEFLESDNTVMVHIRKIREKIEENPRKPKFIKTVWGVGYKIEK